MGSSFLWKRRTAFLYSLTALLIHDLKGMSFIFGFLYDAGIRFYLLGISVSSLWNSKASQWRKGRVNLFAVIQNTLIPGQERVWFHCASAGEFEQGRPVIEAYRKRFPGQKIVLTFFSPSGFELRKNYSGADYIFYLPIDTRANAKKFLSLVDPKLVVFIKYEYWFHFISEIIRRKIPMVFISVAARKKHSLFNPWMMPLKKVVSASNRIFVQDLFSLQLFRNNGFENAELAGDTRFDRVSEIASIPGSVHVIETFKNDRKLLVAGSTWPRDEQLIFELAGYLDDDWRLVVVPHEVSSTHLKKLQKHLNRSVILYSEAEEGKEITQEKILIVDRSGLLSRSYQYADIAYIGGGFGKGIHNTLEPAAFGIPVIFGPNYQRFKEAKLLIENGGGKSIRNIKELKNSFDFYLRKENHALGRMNREWVQASTGATAKIMNYIAQLNSNNVASPE